MPWSMLKDRRCESLGAITPLAQLPRCHDPYSLQMGDVVQPRDYNIWPPSLIQRPFMHVVVVSNSQPPRWFPSYIVVD